MWNGRKWAGGIENVGRAPIRRRGKGCARFLHRADIFSASARRCASRHSRRGLLPLAGFAIATVLLRLAASACWCQLALVQRCMRNWKWDDKIRTNMHLISQSEISFLFRIMSRDIYYKIWVVNVLGQNFFLVIDGVRNGVLVVKYLFLLF